MATEAIPVSDAGQEGGGGFKGLHALRGLESSARRLGRTVLDVIATRFEILSTELADERNHLTRLAFVALTVQFCVQIGLMLAVVFIVLAANPGNRIMAIGLAAIVMLLGGFIGLLWMRSWLKNRPTMFATTVAELRKDSERLRGRMRGRP
jgi:uncharacterized membrane protein YqjE